jgi:hypothetical protein
MSEPTRLFLEPENELETALLGAARPRAPRAARQRAVVATTAALATSGLAAGTAAAGAKAGTLAAVKWVGVAGLLGVGAMTAAVAVHERMEAPQALDVPTTTAVASGPIRPVPVSTAYATSIPTPSSTPTPNRTPTPNPTSAPDPSASASSMTAELATLETAHAALSSGNPARALSILDDYASRFPHASMAPEATVLRIDALTRAGDPSAAKRVADAFLVTNPQSPYAARIRSLVGETNP